MDYLIVIFITWLLLLWLTRRRPSKSKTKAPTDQQAETAWDEIPPFLMDDLFDWMRGDPKRRRKADQSHGPDESGDNPRKDRP